MKGTNGHIHSYYTPHTNYSQISMAPTLINQLNPQLNNNILKHSPAIQDQDY